MIVEDIRAALCSKEGKAGREARRTQSGLCLRVLLPGPPTVHWPCSLSSSGHCPPPPSRGGAEGERELAKLIGACQRATVIRKKDIRIRCTCILYRTNAAIHYIAALVQLTTHSVRNRGQYLPLLATHQIHYSAKHLAWSVGILGR